MKLSVSNIAWGAEADESMYRCLAQRGFQGLEAAPTRLFPDRPYEHQGEAASFAAWLREEHGLTIPSLQSIWFGRTENLFAGEEEREALLDYTRRAMDFAAALGCGNLVFGCPRNRAMNGRGDRETAVRFFRTLGDYAARRGTVLAMEANPPLYHTDFINTTREAFQLVDQVSSPGFLVNLDVGTMLANGEGVDQLSGRVGQIHHVHISTPGLGPVAPHPLHGELAALLREEGYGGFVSIEMGSGCGLSALYEAMDYVKELFS